MKNPENWYLYKGKSFENENQGSSLDASKEKDARKLPPSPPWRRFGKGEQSEKGQNYIPDAAEIEIVNAALYLRRPLLITGKPGTGKSSLAYSVAHELNLGKVLRWNITSRTTLKDGLYSYDAISRLQDSNLGKGSGNNSSTNAVPDIGNYIRLGPLGTAFMSVEKPRVLLIDEIDKSDIDLPNDLLNIFEEGEFLIPELFRLPEGQDVVEVYSADSDKKVTVTKGKIQCTEFPFVILSSNGEREFPPAFLRRCLRLNLAPPNQDKLTQIVEKQLGLELDDELRQLIQQLIQEFANRQKNEVLATDQLLNAIFLITQVQDTDTKARDLDDLIELVKKLNLLAPLDRDLPERDETT